MFQTSFNQIQADKVDINIYMGKWEDTFVISTLHF